MLSTMSGERRYLCSDLLNLALVGDTLENAYCEARAARPNSFLLWMISSELSQGLVGRRYIHREGERQSNGGSEGDGSNSRGTHLHRNRYEVVAEGVVDEVQKRVRATKYR